MKGKFAEQKSYGFKIMNKLGSFTKIFKIVLESFRKFLRIVFGLQRPTLSVFSALRELS